MVYQILTALVALTSVMVAIRAQQTRKPWYCQSYDCPSFTSRVEGTGFSTYQVRNYAESTWVTTSITSNVPDPSTTERRSMFRKLFRYISGENASGLKIDMTVPVLTKTEELPSGYRVSMMFYLSIPNPPVPTSDSVVLETRPAGNVFVKAFPGYWWPANSTYRQKVRELRRDIGLNNGAYNDNIYFKAGYNAPYDYFSRKQFEVWVDSVL